MRVDEFVDNVYLIVIDNILYFNFILTIVYYLFLFKNAISMYCTYKNTTTDRFYSTRNNKDICVDLQNRTTNRCNELKFNHFIQCMRFE